MSHRLTIAAIAVFLMVAVSCLSDNSNYDVDSDAFDSGFPSATVGDADNGGFPGDAETSLPDEVSDARAGDLTGTAVDPRDNSPVEGAEARLLFLDGTPADPTVLTTGPDGKFTFASVAATDYIVEVSHPTHLTAEVWTQVFDSGQTTLSNVWLVPKPIVVEGQVSGTIKNALTGIGVPNVSLEFRAGINAPDTETVLGNATTNAAGNFVADLDAGVYTIHASAVSLCDTNYSVYVLGARTTGNQSGSMTTQLAQGQMRIVLTWGVTPSDLDSHLWAPHDGCESANPFHLYYGNNGSHGCTAAFDLDLDDVTSYGPETTTVGTFDDPITFSPYNFLVHDYSNLSSPSSQAMSNSQGLRVEVFTGNSDSCEQLTFTMPPNTPATVWHVFEAQYDGTDWFVTPVPEDDAFCFQSSPTSVGPTC